MIPLALAPEPPSFEAKVRRKGADAIAELVGEARVHSRRGPKRKAIASLREQIPPSAFPPYWRDVQPEMLTAYHHLCAYLAMYLEPATGNPSVDHVIPRSKSWKRVYEWSNYRLAASLINAKKNDLELVLDPIALQPGSFALEMVELQVIAGSKVKGQLLHDVVSTIEVLGLNLPECRKQRLEYVTDYQAREITLRYLERRAPFIAQELRRQGLLNSGDV